jgi:hypothetical protein
VVEHGIAGDAFTNVQGRLRDVYEIRLVILELLVSKLFAAPVLREKSDRVSGVGGGRCRVRRYGCADGRFSCIGFW